MQEVLLAVHLKRHTYDPAAPFAPWLFAVTRNKVIDALRRRGRRVFVPIEDFAETLPSEQTEPRLSEREVDARLKELPQGNATCCGPLRSTAHRSRKPGRSCR